MNIEHINYLMRGFHLVSEVLSEQSATEITGKAKADLMRQMIKDFLPRMLEHCADELYRSKIGDVTTLMDGHQKLWENKVITNAELGRAHSQVCEVYLNNYLDKTKRSINGKEFADILK